MAEFRGHSKNFGGIQKIFAVEFKIVGVNSKNLHGGIQNSKGELKQISMRVNMSKRGHIQLHVPRDQMHRHGPLWFWSCSRRLHCSVFDVVRDQQSTCHLGSEAPEKTYPTFVQAGHRKELEMIEDAQNNDSKVLDVGELSTQKQHPRCQRNFQHSAHDMLDFHNKVTTSETLISDYKVRSQLCNNVKSSLIMVYYLY